MFLNFPFGFDIFIYTIRASMFTKEKLIERIKYVGAIKREYGNLPKALSSMEIENSVRELTTPIFCLKDSLVAMLEIFEAITTYDEFDAEFRKSLNRFRNFNLYPSKKKIVMYSVEDVHVTVSYDLENNSITTSNSTDLYNNCIIRNKKECFLWRNEIKESIKFKTLQEFCTLLPSFLETFNLAVYARYIADKDLIKIQELKNNGD